MDVISLKEFDYLSLKQLQFCNFGTVNFKCWRLKWPVYFSLLLRISKHSPSGWCSKILSPETCQHNEISMVLVRNSATKITEFMRNKTKIFREY